MLFSKKLKTYYNTESGRSMIEMLGVLAIIGVLSIAGIAGYRFAITKYRSNEIINELNMRAMSISTRLVGEDVSPEALSALCDTDLSDGFSDKVAGIYSVNAYLGCPGMNHFEVYVQNVESDVCRRLMRDYITPLCIVADTESSESTNWDSCLIDESQCGSDQTVNMAFIYNNDLVNGERACPNRSEFSPSDYRCHCGGGTYVNQGECQCPAGHEWNEETGSCYSNPCGTEAFVDYNGRCISCSEKASYQITNTEASKISCEQCSGTPRRSYMGTSKRLYCVNVEEHNCVEGETFLGSGGKCYDCKSKIGIGIDENDSLSKMLCESEKCGRKVVHGYYDYAYCIREDMCESGSEFMYDNAAHSGYIECRSCDSDDSPTGKDAIFKTMCENCGNRTYNATGNPSCVRSSCVDGEFKGSDNKCYSCVDTVAGIAVRATGSGCEDTDCGREIKNGRCQVKSCPTGTHVRTDDGSCYDCTQQGYFWATEAQCESCTNVARSMVTLNSSGLGMCARDDTCELGKGFPYAWGAWCYSCGDWHSTGSGELSHRYCNALGGHIAGPVESEWYCICNRVCAQKEKFIDSVGACHACTTPNAVKISTHSVDREHCAVCETAPRFWVGEYCYPCDTAESPEVNDQDEIDNCLSCGSIRTVKDGACVLVTAS